MTAPPVAPFNPNPKWPGGYIQVLRDQGIEESNIPHFLRWVRGFFEGHRHECRRLRPSFFIRHPNMDSQDIHIRRIRR